jgi:hypothetical protein
MHLGGGRGLTSAFSTATAVGIDSHAGRNSNSIVSAKEALMGAAKRGKIGEDTGAGWVSSVLQKQALVESKLGNRYYPQ